MEVQPKYQERTYNESEICVFRKTKELFGGLSNMASGFPITVNGVPILSSEALYQACRFPHLPDVQKKIIVEKSPMTAKMVSKPFREDSRLDWEKVKVDVMYWCLKVKLAQNFLTFGRLLETTFDKYIVEDSSKDPFWGAIRDKNKKDILTGVNALGRLIMKLRQEYNSINRFKLLFVTPLHIPNFLLFGKEIQAIDERQRFIDSLNESWGYDSQPFVNKPAKTFGMNPSELDPYSKFSISSTSIVAEPSIDYKKNKKTKTKPNKIKNIQPKLPL